MSGAAIRPAPDLIDHASCVALQGHAALIRGASGSGKSALALKLMALGAALISDDRTCLRSTKRGALAYAPPQILGRIEARGVGILQAQPAAPAIVRFVVDLDQIETERLPDPKTVDILGYSCPLLHKVDSDHFSAAVLQYLKAGRWITPPI